MLGRQLADIIIQEDQIKKNSQEKELNLEDQRDEYKIVSSELDKERVRKPY